MRRPVLLLILLAGSVLALDLWTKQWASETLAYQRPVPVLGEFVRLTYTRNSGVAFGLGAGTRFPYYIFSILAAIIILFLFLSRRVQTLPRKIGLSLILGGALGNLVDRLRTGEVVDFIEIGWDRWHWPVFNVADSAVTIGVLLFAFTWARRETKHQIEPSAPGASPTSEPSTRAPHTPTDDSHAGSFGSSAPSGRAAGSLPRGGPDGPLP